MAVASALLTLCLFYAGFHDSPERIESGLGKFIAFVGPLAVAVTCLALAMREGAVAVTADRAWARLYVGCEIELIR